MNILSIDLEDWHQLVRRRITGQFVPARDHVFRQLDALLGILSETRTRATFFAVGMLIEQYPQLIRRVVEQGHEVGCHGYSHLLVYRLTREQFAADTARAKKLLEDVSGTPVRGYRAAEFSIRRESLWALEELAKLGFEYDSSIFPIRHRRYGIPDFERRPTRYPLPGGLSIIEFPLSRLDAGPAAIPVAGGGYFRLLPIRALSRAVAKINAVGLPFVTYFHPYEFDTVDLDAMAAAEPDGIKATLRARIFGYHQNFGRGTMAAKLSAILRDHHFSTFREYLDAHEVGESRTLLS